ncbi:MAG TPA: D-alanine--D-alanine ligase A [Candidatus Magasanikbacteria bacterium]|nr:D-alanine--D-alanine ligase A [Candidatus Magasanikbacteria bacterium]HBX16149.1 D-alanine--D-alanine ligase A [Candidatus Magasanikbacteria bacterium]
MPTKCKLNIAILFGGRSAEHEVSLQSAKNVISALDKTKYNPIPIFIDKSGRWFLNDKSGDKIALLPQSNGEITNLAHPQKKQKINAVFPILHGPFGEDGTVQGLLKLTNVPFVGASVLGSAVGMDKDVMKRLLRDADIPIGKFLVFKKTDKINFEKNVKRLGLPLFIKPANLGSSVGISKVKNKNEFTKAIAYAFKYDTKILIEEFINGREIECSVLGNDKPIASIPGEIIPSAEFYSYDAKYIDDKGARLEVPAKLINATRVKIQKLAVKAFQTLCCEGMGRVDFFLKKNGQIFVNEINTIPGFTAISMYPRLWAESGLNYTKLTDKLIQLAIDRFIKENKLKTSR